MGRTKITAQSSRKALINAINVAKFYLALRVKNMLQVALVSRRKSLLEGNN